MYAVAGDDRLYFLDEDLLCVQEVMLENGIETASRLCKNEKAIYAACGNGTIVRVNPQGEQISCVCARYVTGLCIYQDKIIASCGETNCLIQLSQDLEIEEITSSAAFPISLNKCADILVSCLEANKVQFFKGLDLTLEIEFEGNVLYADLDIDKNIYCTHCKGINGLITKTTPRGEHIYTKAMGIMPTTIKLNQGIVAVANTGSGGISILNAQDADIINHIKDIQMPDDILWEDDIIIASCMMQNRVYMCNLKGVIKYWQAHTNIRGLIKI